MEETGERFSASELFRFKGRALMAGDSPDPQGATAAYEAGVRAAREQNAKLLELRAATRLAEHQRAIGEPTQRDRPGRGAVRLVRVGVGAGRRRSGAQSGRIGDNDSMTDSPRVTVAGGGLAGLTAALRLAQRGYRVKLYEQKAILGGDLGSRPFGDGVDLDIYPHMYLSWYGNFWRLLEEVTGEDRSDTLPPVPDRQAAAPRRVPEVHRGRATRNR